MKKIIVIPTLNEEKTIKEAIFRIPRINERISKTEVIAADNDGGKIYKCKERHTISNLWIVSMIPGDREVAGCFNNSDNLGGYF